jgi:hypothetical protein
MGLAFLAKGPVGVVLPAVASLAYLGSTKNLGLIKINHILLALTTIAVIASPWFYAAYLANGSSALIYFFVHENVQRFAGAAYDAHKPFGYMIVGFFLGFAPWSILLPPAFIVFCRQVKQTAGRHLSELPDILSGELFLWLWVFVAVGFFYTLPAYPAAAILAAAYWERRFTAMGKWLLTAASAILVLTILFAILALPQLNRLEPVDKCAALIKLGPGNLRVGIDKRFASWIDEILFRSGKDPQRLDDLSQMRQFVAQESPALLIVPIDKYKLLSPEVMKNWHIIVGYKTVTHALTPGYIISRKDDIVDPVPLIVATNSQIH